MWEYVTVFAVRISGGSIEVNRGVTEGGASAVSETYTCTIVGLNIYTYNSGCKHIHIEHWVYTRMPANDTCGITIQYSSLYRILAFTCQGANAPIQIACS